MKEMVLFDMDGTLTPARRKMADSMALALNKLSQRARIGIVSGSGFDYIIEQCPQVTHFASLCQNLTIFPCNGTKVYKYHKGKWIEAFNVDMKNHIGPERYRRLVRKLLVLQLSLMDKYEIPVTGNFISDRGSMVNWCPIGRDAGAWQRARFVDMDQEDQIRARYHMKLYEQPEISQKPGELLVALGGQTSFDIYPVGWDKTFAIRHHLGDGAERVWFVGDKCGDTGNDRAAYEYVRERWNTGFWVDGPEQTLTVINNIYDLDPRSF